MIGGDIGHFLAAIFLLIFAVHVYPLWRIVNKMGYPGVLALLAFVPFVHLILVYFLALREWPVLRRLDISRSQPKP
jgi:hypothetical protein